MVWPPLQPPAGAPLLPSRWASAAPPPKAKVAATAAITRVRMVNTPCYSARPLTKRARSILGMSTKNPCFPPVFHQRYVCPDLDQDSVVNPVRQQSRNLFDSGRILFVEARGLGTVEIDHRD